MSNHDEPAQADSPQSYTVEQSHCRGCGIAYRPNKAWQKFHDPECKKRYESIVSEFLSDIREPSIKMAETLASIRVEALSKK